MAHHTPLKPEQVAEQRPFLEALGRRVFWTALAIGALALVASYLLGLAQADGLRRFYFSYLVAFVYFVSISLGALCFTMIQHLVRASWSVVVRRLAEVMAATLPIMAVLALPIVIPILGGNHSLYPGSLRRGHAGSTTS